MLIHLVASLILCRPPSMPISLPACLPASNACLNALNARLPVHACPLQSVWEVEQVVANYSQAGLPLEAIWTDVRGAGSKGDRQRTDEQWGLGQCAAEDWAAEDWEREAVYCLPALPRHSH